MCSCTGYCVCLGRNDSNKKAWILGIGFVLFCYVLAWLFRS